MHCKYCKSYVAPRMNWNIVLIAIAFSLLVGFISGQLFLIQKVHPIFEARIERDGEIKEELRKWYTPPRPETKGTVKK